MNRKFLKAVAIVSLTGLLGAACTSDDDPVTAGEPTETTVKDDKAADDGVDSGAASLRATLTAGLQEHVYLAGIALVTAVSDGPTSDSAGAAVATLDENSKVLAGAIGSVYGDEAGDQFLELWRKHIGFFVDYTLAKAGGDDAAAQAARDALDGYRNDFGAFLASANPNLPKEAVAEELIPHVNSVFDTIDSLVAGETDVFEKLRIAAGHMPGTAAVLSGAIATQFPDKFSGTSDSPASGLRSTLTAALQEHVYLAGIALRTAVVTAPDSEATGAAVATLDENSKVLAGAIGSVYGDEAGDQFLELWRKHIGFFVDYTLAKAGGDDAAAQAARDALDGYRNDFGAFLASANPNLPKEAVAEELIPHVNTVFDTIDALVAGDGAVFENLRKAAGVMPGTAAILSGGIAAQFPELF